MSRLPPLSRDRLLDQQREVYDAIVAGPRGRVRGPLAIWLYSPDLAARAQALGAFCRYGSSLEPRLSELAILITATHWRAGFEWSAHAPAALAAGLAPDQVDALRRGERPTSLREDEQAVYDLAVELLESRQLSKPTYDRAVRLLGERAAVDLVGVLGYYALISMTIKAFDIPPPDGEPDVYAG